MLRKSINESIFLILIMKQKQKQKKGDFFYVTQRFSHASIKSVVFFSRLFIYMCTYFKDKSIQLEF
jgi:hypothetical protein